MSIVDSASAKEVNISEELLTKFWNYIDSGAMFIPPSSKIVDIMLDQKFFVFGKSEIYGRSFCKRFFQILNFTILIIFYISLIFKRNHLSSIQTSDLNYSKSYSIYTHT